MYIFPVRYFLLSPDPVLRLRRTRLLLIHILLLRPRCPWHLEEQARALAFTQQMVQISSMRRIPIVLYILPTSRIGEPIRILLRLQRRSLRGLSRRGIKRWNGSLQRDDGIDQAAQHALDRGRGVEARGDGAAGTFDGGDGGGGGA